MVGCADTAQTADGRAEIHVIACDEQSPSPPPETSYTATVLFGQSISAIDREQPTLAAIRLIETRQNRIGLSRGTAVARVDGGSAFRRG
jgi:hypothetical protein